MLRGEAATQPPIHRAFIVPSSKLATVRLSSQSIPLAGGWGSGEEGVQHTL